MMFNLIIRKLLEAIRFIIVFILVTLSCQK
jgi:hypothetical protein